MYCAAFGARLWKATREASVDGSGSQGRGAREKKEKKMFKSFPRAWVGTLVAFVLVFAFASAAGGARARREAESVNFNLRTVEGGSITAEMLRGDVVVLAFGASWLPLSRAQVQGVQRVADEFAARDVRVYWVSTDSDKPQSKNYATDDQLRAFARRNSLKIAVLRDPDGELFKTLGVERNQLPALVIIDKQGNVSETIGGLAPEGDLVQQLSPKLTKLLGAQQ
jgi:peroxiredoxin